MTVNAARKVIVIGLDGFEPRLAERLLDAGALPHLARLRREGGYGRVKTTYPAQTPVAWSTFATGTNPGGHGIFDFVRRDPRTYLPDLSLTRFEQKSAYLPPKAVNLRRGTPVWELLGDAGLPSVILRHPCTFPPDRVRGRMLAGMGVPDLRGGLGTSTLYTSTQGTSEAESEHVIVVKPDSHGVVSTHIIGPRNPASGSDFLCPVSLHLDSSGQTVTVRSDGHAKALEVREGEWSDWLKVRFKTGLLQSVTGMVRFHLVRTTPELDLYASPVNFDPEAPLFPISAPPGYAKELARQVGTFYTTGMVEDHGGLNNGRFGEAAFLAQCRDVLRERTRMMRHELERLGEGMFFCLVDTPDRIQHMFWRFQDVDGQPRSEPEMARVIDDHYHACDEVIGEALRYADDQTLVIVLSDHGMKSFRRGVHLNTWLYEQGLLTLRGGTTPGDDAGTLFRDVDWGSTRAYALGLSGIYLNLQGREAHGIVGEGEAEGLKAAIVEQLRGLGDPQHGVAAVRSVLTREELYRGPYADESPDLIVNFSDGYRVSWGTALGGLPAGIFEDNVKKWSGDHLMDPAIVPGVLFMNRPFRTDDARLLDLAPTILAALGVPQDDCMEGGSLLT